jgi:hypothetical protein
LAPNQSVGWLVGVVRGGGRNRRKLSDQGRPTRKTAIGCFFFRRYKFPVAAIQSPPSSRRQHQKPDSTSHRCRPALSNIVVAANGRSIVATAGTCEAIFGVACRRQMSQNSK